MNNIINLEESKLDELIEQTKKEIEVLKLKIRKEQLETIKIQKELEKHIY